MSVLLQDLGFNVVAVVILALGVGATTAIFSVLRGLRNEVLYLAPPQPLAYLCSSSSRRWPTDPRK